MLDYQREEIRLAQEWFQVEYKQLLLFFYYLMQEFFVLMINCSFV